MLPLWIIDLTSSPDRRAHLLKLLGALGPNDNPDGQTKAVFSKREGEELTDDDVTSGEACWLYTHYKTFEKDERFDLTDLDDEKTHALADEVYAFQNEMVRDGQMFVKMIRHSQIKAYTSLNICVLGDATEPQTQMVFSSIALFLQKEKGRMLANHIHQGMSIMGALFVPSDINSFEVQERERLLRTLMEVDVQHQVSTIRGYDHMLLFQDVQNRVDKYYTLLDPKEQAEFIFQSLVHLFYASNTQHPLISGVAAADSFYLSMGAASVCFDDSYQDKQESCDLATRMMEVFYAQPKDEDALQTDEERKDKRVFIPFEAIDLDKVLNMFTPGHIVFEKTLPQPYPDPLSDFADKQLERRYFSGIHDGYLLNRLAEYRRLLNDQIETSTRTKLGQVHTTFAKNLTILQENVFPEAIMKFIERCNLNEGGLYWLETQLKELRDKAGDEKKLIPEFTNRHVWENVEQVLEKKYADSFEDYHAAYIADLERKPNGHFCDDKKAAAIDNLCNHLKQETPVLSRFGRAVLLGIVTVLLVMPILGFLSPFLPMLENFRKMLFFWTALLFLIPGLVELGMGLRYLVKRERKERRLYSYYLHDAYARIANRIVSESNNYYDKLIQLCDLYLQRCAAIREKINLFPAPEKLREEIPFTMFNQPLIGGAFNGHQLLNKESLEPKMISVNHMPKEVDKLYPDDFFSLIHLFKEDFHHLFDGVRIPEQHPVELDKTQGTVRLLSQDEVDKMRSEEWQKIREKFTDRLPALIEDELIPLQHPSASGMLIQYFDKTGRTKLLRPFIQFAATNGEFVTSADIEQVDIKTQDDKLLPHICRYLPEHLQFQVEPGGDDDESQATALLYKKYIFLTRWDAFETLALNRILPKEDFDIEEQKKQINEEERDGRKKKKGPGVAGKAVEEDDYPIATSSAILWSLCEGDNSIHWLKLFHAAVLFHAREKSAIINTKLTQKD